MRFDATSFRRAICALAAIVLALNWTAPGPAAPDAVFGTPNVPPGYAASEGYLSPGTLPRVAPHQAGVLTALKVALQKLDTPPRGDTPAALPANVFVLMSPLAARGHDARLVAATSVVALRVFDARAPPRLSA